MQRTRFYKNDIYLSVFNFTTCIFEKKRHSETNNELLYITIYMFMHILKNVYMTKFELSY